MKIFLYYIGKPRDEHANSMAAEYVKRTIRYLHCEMREVRPDRFDPWTRHPAASRIVLDPGGRAMDSAGFIALVARAARESRDLVFLIGGADGVPAEWKPRADLLLALSPLTLPHELARVVLAEQIYRAATSLRGHPYAR